MSHTGTVPVAEGASAACTAEVGPFRFTRATFSGCDFVPPHRHDRACVAVMLRGSFDLIFPGRASIACEPGTLSVDPAGDSHSNRIGNTGANVVVIQPDIAAHDSLRPFARFLDGIREMRRPECTLVGRRIQTEILRPDAFSALVLEGLALELLSLSARLAHNERACEPPRWLQRAEDMLRSRFTEPLTVARIARECTVHPAHLARVFRRHHGCTIGEFLRRCRLEWAADQLTSSRQSIARIAAEAGFADQSHFTNRFREQMGATPAQWRRIRSA